MDGRGQRDALIRAAQKLNRGFDPMDYTDALLLAGVLTNYERDYVNRGRACVGRCVAFFLDVLPQKAEKTLRKVVKVLQAQGAEVAANVLKAELELDAVWSSENIHAAPTDPSAIKKDSNLPFENKQLKEEKFRLDGVQNKNGELDGSDENYPDEKQNAASLYTEHIALKEQLEAQNKIVASLQASLKDWKERYAKLMAENEGRNAEVAMQNEEIHEFLDGVKTGETDQDDLKKANEKLKEKNMKLLKKIKALGEANSELTNIIKEQTKTLRYLAGEKFLEAEMRSMKSKEDKKLQKQVEELRLCLENSQLDILKSKNEIKKLKKSFDFLSPSYEELARLSSRSLETEDGFSSEEDKMPTPIPPKPSKDKKMGGKFNMEDFVPNLLGTPSSETESSSDGEGAAAKIKAKPTDRRALFFEELRSSIQLEWTFPLEYVCPILLRDGFLTVDQEKIITDVSVPQKQRMMLAGFLCQLKLKNIRKLPPLLKVALLQNAEDSLKRLLKKYQDL